MSQRLPCLPALVLLLLVGAAMPAVRAEEEEAEPPGRVFYVRQTVGDDLNDGLSPETAWAGISKLGRSMEAGDTAYVGPGLYRENVAIQNDGTPDRRITIIADTTGEFTGDPPGIVMVTGGDPVNERIFEPTDHPGVYVAPSPDEHVLSVTQMDSDQYRYKKARDTKEHLIDGLTELEVVAELPSSFYYDKENKVVYIHTSDGKAPTEHEIELIHRGNGFSMYGRHYITIAGFTIRHVGDAGITFFTGSSNGIAINNTSYGNRQGVRVYAAENVLVAHNTLFRNDNCGVYYAKKSTDGMAIDNVLYENIKGVRWSSESDRGMAIGNISFDNHERGISMENTSDVRITGNTLVNNTMSQILDNKSHYVSESNCFRNGSTEQLTVDVDFYKKYKSLDAYRSAEHQDMSSREGDCAPLPEKVDVHELHARTLAYTEQARKKLKEAVASAK